MATVRSKVGFDVPIDPVNTIPWRHLAATAPLIAEWVVQRFGPIDDNDPGCDLETYEEICRLIKEENGITD